MISTKAFPAYGKQDPTFIGSYIIKKKLSPLVYELDLPKGTQFHPRFNIEKLKQYQENPEHFNSQSVPPPPVIKENETEYEVEKILQQQV